MDEMISTRDGNMHLSDTAELEIIKIEQAARQIKAAQDAIKRAILAEMEQKNIIKLETDRLTITYIAPSDRESFDSKRMREQWPDLYDEFVKITPVKSSVRFKVKDHE